MRQSRAAQGVRAGRAAQDPRTLRQARKVGDIRKGQRRREILQRYTPLLRRIAVCLAGVAVVVVVALCIYNSPLFAVKNIEVDGAYFLTAEEVGEISGVGQTTLLRLDKSDVTSKLEENLWIESAEVSRVYPDTVRISITERQPDVVVQTPITATQESAVDWAMTADGIWLVPINRESAEALDAKVSQASEGKPYISSLSTSVEASQGATCDDAGLKNALAVLEALSPQLYSQVSGVYAPSVEQTELVLTSGITVAFGSVEGASDKERVALQLLAEHEGQISYINVRVPERPVWRGIESADTSESSDEMESADDTDSANESDYSEDSGSAEDTAAVDETTTDEEAGAAEGQTDDAASSEE